MDDHGALFSIGQFAFLSGLTVKALRHYDRIGLLEPAHVDRLTGDRYYAGEQLRTADSIRRLRRLDVPLGEVRTLLGADDGSFRARLSAHRDAVAGSAAATHLILAELDQLIAREEPLVPDEQLEIEIRDEHQVRLAAVIKHVRFDDIADALFAGFATTRAWAEEQGSSLTWAPIAIFRAADGDDWNLVEAGWPVEDSIADDDRIGVHVYPPTRSASYSYRGRWQELAADVQRFVRAVLDRGLQPTEPLRIVYLTDMEAEQDPLAWQARVYWPIA